MKTALITGITGMVGSHLADYILENSDWNIVGMARWRSPIDNIEHLVGRINEGDRIRLSYGDLNDIVSLQNVIKSSDPDYIFHLAAQSFPKTSFESPIETYSTNIIGTANLLEAARLMKSDPWIHICSSSEVFGRVPKENLPINEECQFHPASPYAISKIGTDLIARFHADAYGQKVISTRMFTHTGPRRGDVFAESSFAKQIALIEAGLMEPVIKVGNLDSLRTFADVRDAVRAYFMLLTESPISGEFYNIGGEHVARIGEMLDYLISLSNMDDITIEVDESRLRPIDADLQVPDTTKFREHTSWSPVIPFEKTMQDLLDYWRDRISRGTSALQR